VRADPEVKTLLAANRKGADPKLQNHPRDWLRERYDQLWSATVGLIREGKIELDSILASGQPDPRRGLTVIARPAPAVRQRVAAFVRELHDLEPDQYYYAPSEFHLTVLSLFTATVDHEPFFALKERYVREVDAALRAVAPIQIDFEGITVSPGTVMIQGFFENGALNDLRESLRTQLRMSGLGAGLDRRYRLETAHMAVGRFRAPLRDGKRLTAFLAEARKRSFGLNRITSVSLVKNDWYMSRHAKEIVKRYRLASGEKPVVKRLAKRK
jgi:2'-5' RNA ligase